MLPPCLRVGRYPRLERVHRVAAGMTACRSLRDAAPEGGSDSARRCLSDPDQSVALGARSASRGWRLCLLTASCQPLDSAPAVAPARTGWRGSCGSPHRSRPPARPPVATVGTYPARRSWRRGWQHHPHQPFMSPRRSVCLAGSGPRRCPWVHQAGPRRLRRYRSAVGQHARRRFSFSAFSTR